LKIIVVDECEYARLTVMSDAGYTFPSSVNCGTF
jgi:hypothetical protein